MKVEQAVVALREQGVAVICSQNGQKITKNGALYVSDTGHKMAKQAFLALYSAKTFTTTGDKDASKEV